MARQHLTKRNLFLLPGIFCLFLWHVEAKAASYRFNFIFQQDQVTPRDTVTSDTTKNQSYKPQKRPTYQPKDRFGDPYSNRTSPSPLTPDPNTSIEVEIDTGFNYTIKEKVGDVGYRPTTTMTFDEYNRYIRQKMIRDYWRAQSAGLDGESAVSGRSLIPPIYTSPLFDRIFGGSYVNIQPNGFVNLDFGGLIERVDNPSIPIRQQKFSQFNFDQQINMNVVGKIGEKLEVRANFDSQNTFDFENNFKVEYTGFEEEIIKKIEIGNVNLPVRNSLMSGAQSLFGVKTQLQFGRLFVTGVATTQRGESDMIEIEGGSQSSTFSIRASEYDENRHFFLGHFFRDNYGVDRGEWLASLPQITSGLNVTRLEVYVINRNNDTQSLRNVAAFMDLAEGDSEDVYRDDSPFVAPLAGRVPNQNDANQLFKQLVSTNGLRNIDQIEEVLRSKGLTNALDYVIMKSARKLDPREYTFNSQLGYLSLNRKLQTDEALAVAYEYTYNGKRYKVGELTEDYQNRPPSDIIFMKMLRPNKINTNVPSWELMMKNIYALNASQVSREGFQLRVIYRDDRTGIDNPNLQEGNDRVKNTPLVQLLGLDRLNQSNDPQPDGNFDFIEGTTINLEKGTIIFPVLQPFGNHLAQQFQASEQNLINKYVYDTLYNTTKADAEQVAGKNKFFIEGKYTAGSSTEIALEGINIAPGSVRVFAGNTPLTEGIDYQVDYQFGRVKILNEGIINSGKKIRISYEKASLLNFQTRRFLGTHFDYIFNEDFSIGATLLYLNEIPLVTRVAIGQEPTSNTKWGFDLNYRKDSRFLTRVVDLLPLIQTKELSTITFSSEFAQMLPGTSNKINGEGTSYIEDFETAVTPFNLMSNTLNWKFAATPRTDGNLFTEGDSKTLSANYKRAKLAWYNVDQIFYRDSDRSRLAPSVTKEDLKNHYVRAIQPQEIFNRDLRPNATFLSVFDMAYFPEERGPYNYNPKLTDEGKLPEPEKNWAGITREISSDVDFDKTNIEYIEFWMMDPFIGGERGRNAAFTDYTVQEGSGGKLVFNLGSISEDFIPDGRHGFENGLPKDGVELDNPRLDLVDTTRWGAVTKRQYLNNAFDVAEYARQHQDVGMDGLPDDKEANYFSSYLNRLTAKARAKAAQDPSADNFRFFINEEFDQTRANIITRYKDYNNLESNTPIIGDNDLGTRVTGSPYPDNEDLNEDNTINELEEYYQYEVNLQPNALKVGQNYVVDRRKVNTENGDVVNWYLFRIPIREYDGKYGDINDFKSIRFIRTYLTGFKDPVVLRFAEFQLVGSQWRKFQEDLREAGLGIITDTDETGFVVSSVGYEDNSNASDKTPYVLPPGFQRDRDNTTLNNNIRLNEQSLQLCIDNLENRDARAVFKNVNYDLVNYGRLKMFIHAEQNNGMLLQDGELTAFLRLGTDFTDNYYEIEIPLKVTPAGATDARLIWPDENEIDIALDELYKLKARRNRENRPLDIRFAGQAGKHTIYIKGNPDLSAVLTLMIGARNPDTGADKSSKSVCIWTNELRVTDFDSRAGWASNARVNAKLADLANITSSVRYTSVGFGSIAQKVSQRTRDENLSYDISASVALDKFLPERSRLNIPMFVSFERSIQTPFYDPANPDLPLSASLAAFDSDIGRSNYRSIVEERSTRRSLNFTNVRLAKREGIKTPTPLDLSNFALTYAYSDVERSGFTVASYVLKSYKGALAYNYTPNPLSIEPFKASERLKSPYLQLIKDFNFSPIPTNVSFRWDLDRRFVKNQLRNDELTTDGIPAQYEKLFTFNRLYSLNWNLTKSLILDYNARANAIIDEPAGEINTEYNRDSVLYNLARFGRMKNFDQVIGLTYRLPLDKLPFTNWINADARYEVNYIWTAGSFSNDTTNQVNRFGNQIQNSRTIGVNGKLDLVRLYDKVGYLKKINEEERRSGRPQPRPGERTPQANQPGKAKEKEEGEKDKTGMTAGKRLIRLLMSVRSVSVNVNKTEGTLLPGFRHRAFLFGFDSSFVAPGLPFILGSQDPSIRREAANNGWLVTSDELTTPFLQTAGTNYEIRADVSPFKDFRIQVDLKKNKTANYQEIFRYDPDSARDWISLTPARTGTYSLSYLTIGTAFGDKIGDNDSKAFNKFEEYRHDIYQRLQAITGMDSAYQFNSQDVLVPAFLAAYSGKDPDEAKLSPFPTLPLPNWRIDYSGLSKLPALRNKFSSVTISHGYVSRYTVTSYNNSLLYGLNTTDLTLGSNIEDYTSADNTLLDDAGNDKLVPLYVANQVIISEQFAPLIGVNLRTKNRMTAQISYNKERNIALNLSNTQVTELNSKDVRFDIGYTTSNFKVPFKIKGRETTLKNDLTFRMSFTIRDTQTIQRKLDEPDDITNGNINFQLNPTINYIINQQLSIQFYYRTNINEPRVFNSFRTSSTAFGTQIRFNITQ